MDRANGAENRGWSGEGGCENIRENTPLKNINASGGARPGCAPRNCRPPDRLIGCAFAPLPLVAIQAIKSKTIGDRAATLLAFLLNRRQPGGWAWASNAFLARELGCSVDTVIRAAKQLAAAGLADKHQVPSPDPDDRANRTGYRWRFLFLAPNVRPPQACEGRNAATAPSVARPQLSVHAPVAQTRLNPESGEKENRSTDLSTSRQETEKSPELTPGVVDLAIEIALKAGHAAFAQDLATDRERIAVRVVGQERALLAAVEATASRIGGTKRAKPILDPMGYCFRTFKDYLERGVPADPVYRPGVKPQAIPAAKPLKTILAPEDRPTAADIWAWRRRGTPG